MVTDRQPIFVSGFPWVEPGDSFVPEHSADIFRGFVTIPYSETQVLCDECKDPLPLVARWTDPKRQTWAKYELPRGETANPRSRIYYSLTLAGEQLSSEIPLSPGISRSKLDEDLELEESLSPQNEHFVRMRDLVDKHIEFINDHYDLIRSNRYYWEGNCGGVAIRSVFRTTLRWMRSDNRAHARLALIVKLARDISRTLSQVCENPRVVLRRSREFQKIAKIQEIDPACLRWLARQPGRDVYERAGSRQQLLGIVRKEDTDTLENRVVKDLLHRARVECANYVSIYRKFQGQDRVRTVQKFRRQIIDWEKTSDIARAKRLTGPVQPNYVLLHESKYRKLWDAYQLLLSQQKQKDDIWKWRDRTFSESCEFGLLSLLAQLTKRSQFSRSDVAVRMESLTGKYLSTDTEFGFANFKTSNKKIELFFCHGGTAAQQCPYLPRDILPLAADFFLMAKHSGTTWRIMPVWCLIEGETEKLAAAIALLEQKISSKTSLSAIFPLVMIYHNSKGEKHFLGDRGFVFSVESPLSQSIPKVESFINGSLGIG